MDPLAAIVHRDSAFRVGKALVKRLKELIPRQQFKIPLQAAIGSRVIASEGISGVPLRAFLSKEFPFVTMLCEILRCVSLQMFLEG